MNSLTDLRYLEEVASGDAAFVREMAETFFRQIPDFVQNMQRFLANREYGLLAKEAHTAKSSVLLFGLTPLADRLKELQLLAEKSEQVERYPEIIGEFETTCRLATDEIKVKLGLTQPL